MLKLVLSIDEEETAGDEDMSPLSMKIFLARDIIIIII
jgi:hypothetical protein